MLGREFTFTKRHLGILAILAGFGALLIIFIYDRLGISDPQGGFGPAQTWALRGAFAMILVGISLVPLGKQPA